VDPDPTFHFNADPDPSFQIKAKALKNCSSRLIFQTHILACHLNIDADPGPAYHFDADPDPDPAYYFGADPDPTFQFVPDPQHWLLRVLG
jgi:hypothetical protein